MVFAIVVGIVMIGDTDKRNYDISGSSIEKRIAYFPVFAVWKLEHKYMNMNLGWNSLSVFYR
jgi:hypothetical protein